MKKFTILANLFVLLFASSANAWLYNHKVTVDEIIQWQDNNPVIFTFSNNVSCYVPGAEKELIQLLKDVSVVDDGGRGKARSIRVHCHDLEENINSTMAHRVHKVEVILR